MVKISNKPARLICMIESNTYANQYYKKDILPQDFYPLIDTGLITRTLQGNKKIINLTEKGQIFKTECINLFKLIERPKVL